MSKGIAIETILYLLVGILVVGIVVYLVYTYVIGSPIDEQQCRGVAISWCTGCKNAQADPTAAWSTAGLTISPDLMTCANNYFGSSFVATSDCTAAKDFCRTFIPIT